LPADKADQRREALARRDAMGAAQRAAASRRIAARVASLPELKGARRICCFMSFRTEVDTRPILDWACAQQREILAPRILGPGAMEAAACAGPADLVPGPWDIPEPHCGMAACDPDAIDAVLVPGAVFDEAGGRIGYGGGFYDSFMTRLRPGVPRVALAFETQIVPHLALEPHDLPVDVIVTEERVIRPRAREAAGDVSWDPSRVVPEDRSPGGGDRNG
jgi:5-formyltetrahydrofolate cyclo-ligase